MRSPIHAAFTLLAFSAMLWAQVFGLHRGFVCDCGDVAEVTAADHCHGPHSEACHEHEEEPLCRGEGDEHHDDADTHEHAALVERLKAASATQMHVMAPTPLVSVMEMPEWLVAESSDLGRKASSTLFSMDEMVRPRSWPHVLSHTLALRI